MLSNVIITESSVLRIHARE